MMLSVYGSSMIFLRSPVPGFLHHARGARSRTKGASLDGMGARSFAPYSTTFGTMK